MREIKFRAWDKKYEDMLYSDVQTEEYEFRFTENGIEVYGYSDDFTNPMNVELMQFTGLYDKNGKEIYEGDIVNVNHYGGTPRYETVRFYTIAGFAGIHPFTDSGHHWASHRCEIVGNIYENSERLEGDLAE